MPIYAYKCSACRHGKDVLQKVSDAPLVVCPACGASTFAKQLTAAGFQLKGSGWYATDFRGGSTPAAPAGEGAKTDDSAGTKSADTPAPAAKPDGPSASAGGCGSACACH